MKIHLSHERELADLESDWQELRQRLLGLLLEEAKRIGRSDDAEMLGDLLRSQEPISWVHFQYYLDLEALDTEKLLFDYKQLDRQRANWLADIEIEEQKKTQQRKLRGTFLVAGISIFLGSLLFLLTPDPQAFEVRKNYVLGLPALQTFAEVSYFQSVELVQAMNRKPPKFTPTFRTFLSLQSQRFGSLWSPSTHVWLYEDEAGHIREVLWTGHAERRTRHPWWSLLYNTALSQKARASSQLLLSGVARLEFQYDCESSPRVEKFLQAQRAWKALWRRSSHRANSGLSSTFQTSLERANQRLQSLKKEKEVRDYVQCIEMQGRSFLAFARQAKQLFARDGLSVGHRLPLALLQQARQRMEEAYRSSRETRVVFHDLLRKFKVEKAQVSFPMRWRKSGGLVVFRLSKAAFFHDSLPRARQIYQQELEQVMLGDVREREVLYKRRLKNSKRLQGECKKWASKEPARLNRKIWMDRLCSSDGRCHMAPRPISLRLGVYCKRYVPLNILLAKVRLREVEELLQKIQNPKAKSRLRTFVDQAIWDALLRNAPLPVGRYQEELLQWQAHMRRKLWGRLYPKILNQGMPISALADSRVAFQVTLTKKEVQIRPVWLVELSQTSFVFSSRSAVPTLQRQTLVSRGRTERTCHWKSAPAPKAKKRHPDDEDNPFLYAHAMRQLCKKGRLSDALYHYWGKHQDASRQVGSISRLGSLYLEVMGTMQSFRAVSGDTLWRKGVFHAISRLYRVLRDSRGVPPELHAQLSYTVARHVASFMSQISKQPIRAWDVLASVAGRKSAHSRQVEKLQADARFGAYKHRFFLDVRRLPFAILRRSVRAMKDKDAVFFRDWLWRKGSPKVRSQTMTLLQRFYPPDSWFEQQQIDSIRTVKYLKTYRALQAAARYILTAQVPRLRGLLLRLNRVELLTEADSLIVRRLKDSVGIVSEDTHIASRKLRALIAAQLQRSARNMLQKSQDLLAADSREKLDTPTLRLLKARLYFERGLYQKVLQTLCKPRTPLAFYRPSLRWKLLRSDWRGAVLGIQVKEENGLITVFAAPKGEPQPFLQLSGLSSVDRRELFLQLKSLGALEHPTRKASEQLLMLPVLLPSRVLRTFQRIQQRDLAPAMIRDMVYTCRAPGLKLVHNIGECRFPFVVRKRLQ